MPTRPYRRLSWVIDQNRFHGHPSLQSCVCMTGENLALKPQSQEGVLSAESKAREEVLIRDPKVSSTCQIVTLWWDRNE